MDRLGTFADASNKVLADIQRCIARVQALSAQPFETASAGVGVLQALRRETYEDLNQIQHEHLILRAAQWLLAENICRTDTEWFWNPRQTGNHEEPDLRGVEGAQVVVSAEITTSERPQGVIDTRMQRTLAKLARTEGAKFYFVCTEAMRQRASIKIAKAGWPIQAVALAV